MPLSSIEALRDVKVQRLARRAAAALLLIVILDLHNPVQNAKLWHAGRFVHSEVHMANVGSSLQASRAAVDATLLEREYIPSFMACHHAIRSVETVSMFVVRVAIPTAMGHCCHVDLLRLLVAPWEIRFVGRISGAEGKATAS